MNIFLIVGYSIVYLFWFISLFCFIFKRFKKSSKINHKKKLSEKRCFKLFYFFCRSDFCLTTFILLIGIFAFSFSLIIIKEPFLKNLLASINFFTVQSNFYILIFYFFRFCSYFLHNKKFKKIFQGYVLHASLTILLLVTGSLYPILLFPPDFIHLLKSNMALTRTILFSFVNNIFMHYFIPVIVFMHLCKIKYNDFNEKTKIKIFLISYIYLNLYFIFELFFNLFYYHNSPYWFIDPTSSISKSIGILNGFIGIFIIIIFLFLWYFFINHVIFKFAKFNNLKKNDELTVK